MHRPHDRAAILSVGDELILGQSVDTNSAWLSERLAERAVRVVEHATVPDDAFAQSAALRRLCATVPLVISTGGLGPTADDLTRRAFADVLAEELIEDPAMLARIRARAAGPLTDNNRLQALRPPSAIALDNKHGTAPGLFATLQTVAGACDVFCLPGPPAEMRPMFESSVAPRLRPPDGLVVRTRAVRTYGLPESRIAELLGDLMDRSRNPLVGTTASAGAVTCRIRYEGPASGAPAALDSAEARVRALIGPCAFGSGDETLASVAICALGARNERLVVAESCTGGMLASLLTSVAGCSSVFVGGWITYANEFKRGPLGVDGALLARHGAVSPEVARAMAAAALEHAPDPPGAHHALTITGVAGPTGGTPDKPVGLVYIARASRSAGARLAEIDVRRFLFTGDRDSIRSRSAHSALAMLHLHLAGAVEVTLAREAPL